MIVLEEAKMLEKQDIYGYDRRIERHLANINDSDAISIKNKKLLIKYKEHLFLTGYSKARISKYLEILKLCAEWFKKDFDGLDKEDIESFVAEIQGRNYSPWTKQSYKLMLRRLLAWMNGGKIPESISWLKVHFNRSEKKLPGDGDMITEEELQRAIDVCNNPRDKCILSVLYESGCRIGEIASLRIGNISFDKHGVVLTVIGKTGSRKIRLVKSTAYIRTYMENHPARNDLTFPFWVNQSIKGRCDPMKYQGFRILIMRLFKKAKLNKRCNPHMFRHSRATYMANHLTEFQMNQYFGWIQGSDMPSTYVHLSGRDVDNAILSMNGLADKQADTDITKPIKCCRCEFINPANTQYCLRCSQILDEKTAVEHDTLQNRNNSVNMIMNELIKDPAIQQALMRRVAELGIGGSILNFK